MNPIYSPISFYARSQHGWMLLTALLFMAAAIAAFARAYRLLRDGNAGTKQLYRLAAAVAFAACFRAHDYFPWEGPATVEGTIHMIFSVCAFLLFAYAAFTIAAEQRRQSLLVLAAVFFCSSVLACAEAGMTLLLHQKPQFMGLEERVIMLVALGWFCVLFPPLRPITPTAESL